MPPPVTWLRACTPSATAGSEMQPQERRGVEPGGLEQRLAPRRAEVGGAVAVLDAGAGDDVAHQRVAVGVQAARGEREDRVARLHAVRAEQGVGLDDAGRGARHVVVVRAEQPGMLGGLAADERGAGLAARVGDAAHDVGDALGHDLAARDVVGHEQRARAHHDDVVDDHAHEVLTDGVVLVDRLGDRHLRADPVGARRQQRAAVGAQRAGVEHAGEAADAALHLGPVGRAHGRLHQLDREVAGRRVDARIGVGGTARARCRRRRSVGRIGGRGRGCVGVRCHPPSLPVAPGSPTRDRCGCAVVESEHDGQRAGVADSRGRESGRSACPLPAPGARHPLARGAAAPARDPPEGQRSRRGRTGPARAPVARVLGDDRRAAGAPVIRPARAGRRLRDADRAAEEGSELLRDAITPHAPEALAYAQSVNARYTRDAAAKPGVSYRAYASAIAVHERQVGRRAHSFELNVQVLPLSAARRVVDRIAHDRGHRRPAGGCRGLRRRHPPDHRRARVAGEHGGARSRRRFGRRRRSGRTRRSLRLRTRSVRRPRRGRGA